MNLQEFFTKYPKAALGFSGGVDSSYLLYAAKKYGADVRAYYVHTPFQPEFELEDAKKVADFANADMKVLEYDILQHKEVTDNPSNRCYFCKKQIFGLITKQAKADGYQILLDGTNASDPAADRPGMAALKELEVLSPLRMCDLTKTDIRKLSKEAGLLTWNKPSYACLATRIKSGEKIIREDLEKVERAEEALKQIGFKDFRVRKRQDAALLQVLESQFALVSEKREEIETILKSDFSEIAVDLNTRKAEAGMEDKKSEILSLTSPPIIELNCNVDDMTGEEIGFLLELLMENGALDVFSIPIQMKKSRPGQMLTCLCRPEEEEKIVKLLFLHTTTWGLRRAKRERYTMDRDFSTRQTVYGEIIQKTGTGFGVEKTKPEFQDLASAARKHGVSIQKVKEEL